MPARAALNGEHLTARIERHPVETGHVQHDAVPDERVPAHAVPHAGDGHLQPVLPRETQRLADIVRSRDPDDAVDRRAIETARVVDRASALRPRQRGRRRHNDRVRHGVRDRGRWRRAVLLSERISRELPDLPRREKNCGEYDQRADRERAPETLLQLNSHRYVRARRLRQPAASADRQARRPRRRSRRAAAAVRSAPVSRTAHARPRRQETVAPDRRGR